VFGPVLSAYLSYKIDMGRSKIGVLIYLIHLLVWLSEASTLNDVNIGVVMSLLSYGSISVSNVEVEPAILMAIREINNKSDGIYDNILPTTRISSRFLSTDTFRCSGLGATALTEGSGIVAYLGPDEEIALRGTRPVFEEGNILGVGFSLDSTLVIDRELFPAFLQANPPYSLQGRVLADFIASSYGWRRVCVVHSTGVDGIYSSAEFMRRAGHHGISVLTTVELPFVSIEEGVTWSNCSDAYKLSLEAMRQSGARVYVLLISPHEVGCLLSEGRKRGVFREGIQIIGTEVITYPEVWEGIGGDMSSSDVVEVMRGSIGVSLDINRESDEFSAFVSRWSVQDPTNGQEHDGQWECNNATDSSGTFYLHQTSLLPVCPYEMENESIHNYSLVCTGLNFSTYTGNEMSRTVAFAYDAVIALAHGLHHLLYLSENNVTHADNITHNSLRESMEEYARFRGLSGPVSLDGQLIGVGAGGARTEGLVYRVLNFDPDKYLKQKLENVSDHIGFIQIGAVQTGPESVFLPCFSGMSMGRVCSSDVVFNTADNTRTTDRPDPQTIHLPLLIAALVIAAAVIGILIAITCAVLIYCYREYRLIGIAQPELAYVILTGCITACVAAIVMCLEVTSVRCEALLWLSQLAFHLVFVPLVVKTWRMYMVLNNSLTRVKVTKAQALFRTVLLVVIAVVLLALNTNGSSVEKKTIRDNQFEITNVLCCSYNVSGVYIYLQFGYIALILLMGAVLCFLTRNLPVGTSHIRSAVYATFAVFISCGVTLTIILLTNMKATTIRAVIAVSFVITAIKIMDLLFLRILRNLLEGYDLDKKFQLVKKDDGVRIKSRILSQLFPKKAEVRKEDHMNAASVSSVTAITDERNVIQAQLESLHRRLYILENREIYHSKISAKMWSEHEDMCDNDDGDDEGRLGKSVKKNRASIMENIDEECSSEHDDKFSRDPASTDTNDR